MTTMASSTLLPSLTDVLDFVRNQPLWPVRFLIVYLGNPVLFVAYFVVMCNDPSHDGAEIFGIKTFTTVDNANTSKLNFGLFLLVTLPLYLTWLGFQLAALIPMCLRMFRGVGSGRAAFSRAAFCSRNSSAAACLAAIPGLVNLRVWSSPSGMEGNVMGMLFAPFLLASTIAYAVLWWGDLAAAVNVDVEDDEPMIGVVVGYHIQDEYGGGSSSRNYNKNGETTSAALPAVS